MRRIQVIGPKDLYKYKRNEYINTTSRGGVIWSELSPFLLGPVTLYDGLVSKTMENAWQFAKVYEGYHEDGHPNTKYWKWATTGWNDRWAHRYPMGKGAIPEFTYWNGQVLNYIDARKHVYIPLYEQAVLKTDAWKSLLDVYNSGASLILFDFDGYSDYASLEEVLNNPNRKMGHAFVLAMLLEKYGK